jgi:ribosome-binding protein aMBF1 (putative translation factor)
MPTESEEESYLECDVCGTEIEIGYENIYNGGSLCDGCYEYRREEEERESDSEYISDHDYRPIPLFFNDNGRKSSQQVMIGSMPKIYFGIEIETEAMSVRIQTTVLS